MNACAQMGALSLWSERITMESLLAETPDKLTRQKPSSSIANPDISPGRSSMPRNTA